MIITKTHDEIKNGLECCINDTFGCSERCPYFNPQSNGVDCASELHTDANAYIQQLEAEVPKWISVEDKLPEDDVNVLVYAIGNNENSCVAMTSYTHNMHGYHIEGWRSPWQYFFYEYKITHWMPLPEPPKEDCNAETN